MNISRRPKPDVGMARPSQGGNVRRVIFALLVVIIGLIRYVLSEDNHPQSAAVESVPTPASRGLKGQVDTEPAEAKASYVKNLSRQAELPDLTQLSIAELKDLEAELDKKYQASRDAYGRAYRAYLAGRPEAQAAEQKITELTRKRDALASMPGAQELELWLRGTGADSRAERARRNKLAAQYAEARLLQLLAQMLTDPQTAATAAALMKRAMEIEIAEFYSGINQSALDSPATLAAPRLESLRGLASAADKLRFVEEFLKHQPNEAAGAELSTSIREYLSARIECNLEVSAAACARDALMAPGDQASLFAQRAESDSLLRQLDFIHRVQSKRPPPP